MAVKIAPFNRYYTIEVVGAIAETGREVSLHIGNDDNIVNDLLTVFSFKENNTSHIVRIVGGLLGQWSFWTKKAVDLLEEIHEIITSNQPTPQRLLTLGAQITDANGAIFDVINNYACCIPSIYEVLRKQGLLKRNLVS